MNPSPRRKSAQTYDYSLPKGAVLPKDTPPQFKPIIERMVAHDKKRCLLGEKYALEGQLSADAFAVTARPYIPGELWPHHVPPSVATKAVVFATLLDPARDTDASMIAEWELGEYVKHPCLLRFCAWPGEDGSLMQVVPLGVSTAREYRRLWEGAL